MVSPRPTSLISGETSWLTETCGKADLARERGHLPLVLRIAVGVHEDDGDGVDAVGRAASSSAGRAARSGVCSTVPSARTRSSTSTTRS